MLCYHGFAYHHHRYDHRSARFSEGARAATATCPSNTDTSSNDANNNHNDKSNDTTTITTTNINDNNNDTTNNSKNTMTPAITIALPSPERCEGSDGNVSICWDWDVKLEPHVQAPRPAARSCRQSYWQLLIAIDSYG